MSISPQSGQPIVPILDPNIQIAGQDPLPLGNLALISNFPYFHECLPAVFNRPEVKSVLYSEPV